VTERRAAGHRVTLAPTPMSQRPRPRGPPGLNPLHTFAVDTYRHPDYRLQTIARTRWLLTAGMRVQPNHSCARFSSPSPSPFYYVALVILILTVTMSSAVRRSRFGLQLLAIRDDEARARGLGVKTGPIKLAAFTLSAFPIGMVGGLYFYFLGQIFPQFAYDPLFDISIALMAFLGGIGTLIGPVLGALVLEALQQYLTQSVSGSGTYLIVYGVLFLAVILLLPRGVIPSLTQLVANRRARARQGAEEGRDPSVSRVPGVVR
jgi:ABC-type branched-subunit amino acid transport system permease subunit